MKTVLITGAASGLGWELAQRLHARGHRLLLVDRDAALLEQRQSALPGVQIQVGDLCDRSFVESLPAAAQAAFGGLDWLFNNAGITHRSPIRETDPEVMLRVMTVDWQAPVLLTRAAWPLLAASRGSVINIGSMAGWMPVPGRAAYCAAKAALAQFFEVLRLEAEADGVQVLNVYPSFLDTPIEKNALGGDGRPAGHARSTVGKIRGADWMAERILQALEAGKPWIFGDGVSVLGSLLWRIAPRLYLRQARKRFATELAR